METWSKSLREKADRLELEWHHARRRVGECGESLRKAKKRLKNCRKAHEVLQGVAQQVQQQVHERIATVVTKCLKAVFPNPYSFHVTFHKKRGKTEARFEFRRGGLVLGPHDGVGGSVLDVSAFALQLACLGLQRPVRRKVVFLDEKFGGVGKRQGNKERVRQLIETLADELGFQVVLVTHDKGLECGKVVEV